MAQGRPGGVAKLRTFDPTPYVREAKWEAYGAKLGRSLQLPPTQATTDAERDAGIGPEVRLAALEREVDLLRAENNMLANHIMMFLSGEYPGKEVPIDSMAILLDNVLGAVRPSWKARRA